MARRVGGACYLIGTARRAGRSRADLGGGIMAMKITREVLEAYLNCKTKGHLKLAGETGTESDYEAMTKAARRGVAGAGPRQARRPLRRRSPPGGPPSPPRR